jgi:hypothetical protein
VAIPNILSSGQASSVLDTLRDPSKSLPAFGQVLDQATGDFIKYDPYAITYKMQADILDYCARPPRTSYGQTRFLVLLAGRQVGKSLTSEYGIYCKAAYTPGHDHLTIADTRDRAQYLHQRVHHLHYRWPEEIRAPTAPSREVRQLTFDSAVGGRMRVLSAESGAGAIGQSPNSNHNSEVAWWADAAGQFTLLWPALIQSNNALVINECTPAPADAPSVEWWKDHCKDAKLGLGRLLYKFYPFWDGKRNVRPWPTNSSPTQEELALLNKYEAQGLTLPNLAFRRFMMEQDAQLRRNPELFRIFYPFDDLTCWVGGVKSVLHPKLLTRHLEALDPTATWTAPYVEWEAPQSNAQYVVGVDPAGHAARDHAAFIVLKVWEGEWTVVASFAEHVDPLTLHNQLRITAIRYNNAKIVVESNGVGQAVIALIRQDGYKNLYYEKPYRPGLTSTSSSLDRFLGWLQDALLDTLVIPDPDLIDQLSTYGHDKRIEEGVQSEMLRGKMGRNRRARHHWDKVSALQMAIAGARSLPRRSPPTSEPEDPNKIVLFRDMTWNQIESYRSAEEARTAKSTPRKYRSVRNRSRGRRKRR